MAKRKAGSELPQLLRDLREKPDGTVSVVEVADIVERLMTALQVDPAVSRRKLFTDLKGLSRLIQTTKDEIAFLNPADVKNEYLPKARQRMNWTPLSRQRRTRPIPSWTPPRSSRR